MYSVSYVQNGLAGVTEIGYITQIKDRELPYLQNSNVIFMNALTF